MCDSVELARVLDVNGALLKSTCRQNSAITNLSAMAKIRMAEKVDSKSTSPQPEYISKSRNLSTSSLDSSSSCSYSSSPEISGCTKYASSVDRTYKDFEKLIDGVKRIEIYKSANNNNNEDSDESETVNEEEKQADSNSNFVYKSNIVASDDDKKSEKLGDEDDEDDDEGLIERGPVRPQLHPLNRNKPYVESPYHWPNSGLVQPLEPSTDYDTSAKEILTDREYREKIDFCLDKLSNDSQEASVTNSLSPTHSDFDGAPGYSPPQQQQWQQPDKLPTGTRKGSCSVPSITVFDSENTLLVMLSRGSFQAAQSSSQTPEYSSTGSAACPSDNWPDSPASACATSASRPDSRGSSRAQSPGSNNGFLNVFGSPMGSPQVSPQNFRNLQRPSSSSSSSQSYCETPSPANYQSPIDQHLEEQLGDHIMTRMPAWRDSFESSDTLVNSVASSELQLQLVEEVIRGEMHDQSNSQIANDMQVVPNCRTTSSLNSPTNFTTTNSNSMTSCLDNIDATDVLTNTLLRFVDSEQATDTPRKMESRSGSTTSGYSSNSSNGEGSRPCEVNSLQMEPMKTNFLGTTSRNPTQQPQLQQTVYQPNNMNLNNPLLLDGLQMSTSSVDLMGKNSWHNYFESNSMIGNSTTYNHFNDFQIPETVTSYNSQRSTSSTIKCTTSKSGGGVGERSIAPWPSLNLPSTRASQRLKEMTDAAEVDKAMKNLLKKPLDQLAKGDEDGDTILMCLAGNPLELRKKLAYLAPLVERLGTIDGALSMLNSRGEDALYLAAMNCPQMAFVAGYLAAAFLQKNIDIGQRLYRSRGDTLIHALASKGDTHGEVLAELLSLRTSQGNSVFDLSKRNYDGRTALHVALEAHETLKLNAKITCIGTIRLLLDNGADPTTREISCGNTALHLATSYSCDPSLVKLLLKGKAREDLNNANYNGNTPLHMAAAMSERTSLERQSEVCWHLIQTGSRTNITNRQGKTPLGLVSAERKEALRRIFHKKA